MQSWNQKSVSLEKDPTTQRYVSMYYIPGWNQKKASLGKDPTIQRYISMHDVLSWNQKSDGLRKDPTTQKYIYLCMIFRTKMIKWNWLPQTDCTLCWHFTNSFTNNFDQVTLENGRKTQAWPAKDEFKALAAVFTLFSWEAFINSRVDLWQLKKLIVS